MTQKVQLLRSTVSGHVPAPASMLPGELAVNLPDKALFVGDATGNPVDLLGSTAAGLAAETTNRIAADATNATAIGTEASTRAAADALLASKASPAFSGTIGGTADFSAVLARAAAASVSRSIAAHFGDFASVLDYGADPTGVSDSSAAFNAAFVARPAVYAPAGTYKISNTVTMNRTACALRGDGPGLTILMNNTAAAGTLLVASTVGAANAWVSDLTLDRSVTPTSSGWGLMTDNGALTTGQINIFNVVSQHNYGGFYLGNTAFGIADRCVAQFNLGNGLHVGNGTWSPAAQWTLLNTLSQFNGGDGYAVVTTIPTQNLPSGGWSPTNPAYVTLNTWIYVTTFANRGHGISLSGSPTAPLCDFSLHNSWIGADGGNGISASTYGINNRVSNSVFELISNYGVATAGLGIGPAQNVAAPKTGSGISLTAQNQDWSINGTLITQCAWDGITTQAPNIQVTGNRIFNCGFASSGVYAGINVSAGAAIITGNVITNPSGGGGFQAVAISASDGTALVIVGNDLRFNPFSAGAVYIGANVVLANIYGNLGYISRNAGTVSVAAGATSVVVAHGLVGTPNIVMVTAAGGQIAGGYYVTSENSTTFTVVLAAAPGATTYIHWSAQLTAYS